MIGSFINISCKNLRITITKLFKKELLLSSSHLLVVATKKLTKKINELKKDPLPSN